MGDRDRFRGRERSDSRNRNHVRGGGGDGRDFRDSGRGGDYRSGGDGRDGRDGRDYRDSGRGGDNYRGGGGDMRDSYRGGGEVRDDRRYPGQPNASSVPTTERDRDQVLTTSLLVRNVSYRVRPDELKRIFSRYGDVRDVYIPEVCIMIHFAFVQRMNVLIMIFTID